MEKYSLSPLFIIFFFFQQSGRKLAFTIFWMILFATASGQAVGIGTTTPQGSSILDINSADKGVLISRMLTSQRKAIVNPAPGLLVYDLDKKTIYMFDGYNWMALLFSTNEKKLPPVEVEPVTSPPSTFYTRSVAIHGDYAIVGGSNKAFIFHRENGTWLQKVVLTPPVGETNTGFGTSVAIDGGYAVVGAQLRDNQKGSVFVYLRSGSSWKLNAILTASNGLAGDEFGFSVSISGDYVAVGAATAKVSNRVDQGSAYVYYRGSGWKNNQPHQAYLLNNAGLAGDQFGYSVSIDGDYLMVGAPYDDNTVVNEGSASIFGRIGTSWTTLHKLTANNPEESAWLGYSVSIKGLYAGVGAPGAGERGAFYAFHPFTGDWVTAYPSQGKESAPSTVGSGFGYSVDLFGDKFVVGCSQGKRAYLLGWGGSYIDLLQTIEEDNDGIPYNNIGNRGVGMDGYNIIFGATQKVFFLNIE